MEKKAVISLLSIAAFVLAKNGHEFLRLFECYTELGPEARQVIYKTCWYVAFPLLVIGVLHGWKNPFPAAGLGLSLCRKGVVTGLVGSLPMLLGAGLLVQFHLTIHWQSLLNGCLLAAVGEELLYRAMLFGQLFRHARWGFLWAGLASAVVFGAGHLYQGNSPATLAGVFAVTFMGGMWFSWLYVEYGYNLWVPMSYHFFMNLSWNIFEVGDTALGQAAPNIFRAATIGLSIYLAIRHKRRTGTAWIVRGRRWWSGEEVAGTPESHPAA